MVLRSVPKIVRHEKSLRILGTVDMMERELPAFLGHPGRGVAIRLGVLGLYHGS